MGPRGVAGDGLGSGLGVALPWEGPGPTLRRVAAGRGGAWATVAVLKGAACTAHLSEHLNFPSLYDRPIQLLPGSVSI